jgi:hypothetical protein
MCDCLQKSADILTIVGFVLALVVAFLAFKGFTWAQGRAWLRREVLLRFLGFILPGRKYITLKSGLLSAIPQDRLYKDFDPNKVICEPEDRIGKCFKLNAKIAEKIIEKGVEITDWKGKRYYLKEYILKEIWFQAWPYSYKDANEWKVGISILKFNNPAPEHYEHRLYGKDQICFEISRHHEQGKQAILSVFEGDPLKVRSSRISEGNWTWIRVRIDKKKIEFFVGYESIAVFDTDSKPDIQYFNPGEFWLVFWADEETDMMVRFRNIKTYWKEG